MTNDILQKTPARVLEFWKTEGEPPFCIVTAKGVSGIYELDEHSSFIWLYLDGAHTVDSIVTIACNTFEGAERKQVEKDIIKVLKRLDADDLIHINYNPLYPHKYLKIFDEFQKRLEVQNEHNREK
jgi:hypothetical protein